MLTNANQSAASGRRRLARRPINTLNNLYPGGDGPLPGRLRP